MKTMSTILAAALIAALASPTFGQGHRKGQGVALGVDLLVNDLLQQNLLVRPLASRVHWKEAYYLVSPAGEKLTAEMNALSEWLLSEVAAEVSKRRRKRTIRLTGPGASAE